MADTKTKNGMKVFRTAIGGYNKSDVNSYLIAIDSEYKEREAALRERAERAEKKKCNTLDDDVKSKLEAQIAELEKKLSDKSSASLPDDYAELRKKAQLYEDTNARIGEAIISAKKTAEEIIAEANADADKIRKAAEQDAEERRKAVSESAEKALNLIYTKLKEAATQNCEVLEENSSSIEEKIRRAMMDIRMESASVCEKIAWNESSLRAEISSEISRIASRPSDK